MYNSFSQSLMKKYGWTEGKGIGKDSQGIVNPIKATLKFDSHGISYKEIDSDVASKWSNIYSAAVSNLQVNDDNSISVSKPCSNNEKLNIIGVNVLYKNFVKSAVYLKDGIEINEENENNKKSKKRKRVLSGEKETVKKLKKSKPESEVTELLQSDISSCDKVKAKKSKKCLFSDSDQKNIKLDNASNNDEFKIKKHKKKCLSDKVEQEQCTIDEVPITHKRKKSKKKCLPNDIEKEQVKLDGESTIKNTENKKSKKKNLPKEDIQSKGDILETIKLNENGEKNSKKKSKNSVLSEGPISLGDVSFSDISNSTFMTCYPAARCGIGISGKLARIQKLQDEEKRNSLSVQ